MKKLITVILMVVVVSMVMCFTVPASAGLLVDGIYDFMVRIDGEALYSEEYGVKLWFSNSDGFWLLVDSTPRVLTSGYLGIDQGFWRVLYDGNHNLICTYTILGCRLIGGSYLIIKDAFVPDIVLTNPCMFSPKPDWCK